MTRVGPYLQRTIASMLRSVRLLRHALRSDLVGGVRRVVALSVLSVLAAVIPFVQPVLFSQMINKLIDGARFRDVLLLALAVPALGLTSALLSFMRARVSNEMAARVIGRLQVQTFARLITMPLGFFSTVQPGAVTSRLTSDVNGVEPLYSQVLPTYLSSVSAIAFMVVVLLWVEPVLTLVLLLIPIAVVGVRLSEKRINALLGRSFALNHHVSTTAESALSMSGIIMAREARQTDAEVARFSEAARDLQDVTLEVAAWRAAVGLSYDLVFNVISSVVFVGGAALVAVDRASIGTLLLFVLFVRQIQAPVMELVGLRYPMLRASVALDRVDAVVNWSTGESAPDVPAGLDSLPSSKATGLEFIDVSYRYPPVERFSIPGLSFAGAPVAIASWIPFTVLGNNSAGSTSVQRDEDAVHGLTFAIAPGETVALIGASGAGKSTAALLACGLLLPTAGEVRVAGCPTSMFAEYEIPPGVAFISQSSHVLHGSIRDNLLYGAGELDPVDIERACDIAQLSELIARLPEGYDTIVGEQGHRLSGGERQRLAIARAVLRDAAVVILDEPTAHLDTETEHHLSEALNAALGQCARLVVAHRLSTIRNADRILVLDQGAIVESGTHDELLRDSSTRYAAMFARHEV